MCVRVFSCVCMFVSVMYYRLRATAASRCRRSLFFFLFCALSLSPSHLRFVEFSPLLLPPEQQQQPQPRRIFSLAATVDSSAWCTFFLPGPPLSASISVRRSLSTFFIACVCVYVLYSGLSTYIHRNVCLMPVKWG